MLLRSSRRTAELYRYYYEALYAIAYLSFLEEPGHKCVGAHHNPLRAENIVL